MHQCAETGGPACTSVRRPHTFVKKILSGLGGHHGQACACVCTCLHACRSLCGCVVNTFFCWEDKTLHSVALAEG